MLGMITTDETRKLLQDLTLEDDNFFTACLSGDNECTSLILRIILNRDDLTVLVSKTQDWYQNLIGHSVKLDIWARDKDGIMYDLEIQKLTRRASSRRARFYSASMDTSSLKKGDSYDALPESYVIFITPEDAIGDGQAIYEIERYVNGTGKKYGDGSHIIHVSANLTDEETPLGRLMHDLRCADPDEMHYTELRDKVSYYKRTEKGVAEMSAVFDEMMEKVREMSFKEGELEGRKEGEARSVNNIVSNMLKKNFSIDDIAAATNLPISDIKKMASTLH